MKIDQILQFVYTVSWQRPVSLFLADFFGLEANKAVLFWVDFQGEI